MTVGRFRGAPRTCGRGVACLAGLLLSACEGTIQGTGTPGAGGIGAGGTGAPGTGGAGARPGTGGTGPGTGGSAGAGTGGASGAGGTGAVAGGTGGGTGGAGATGGTGGGTAGAGGTGATPGTMGLAPSPLRRLTHAAYDTTVADLLGMASSQARNFPSENSIRGYTNQAEMQQPSPLLIERYADAAAALAAEAVSTAARRSALVPCAPADAADRACMTTFVKAFTTRAYRRPALQASVDALVAQGLAQADGDFWKGVQSVVETVLQSPWFLYRLEQGTAAAGRAGLVQLDGFSVANRLSYLFSGSMPDAALFDAAGKNQLATPAEVEAQARRLLGLPRAQGAIRDFFAQWLGTADVATVDKEAAAFPRWTPAIAGAMAAEATAFLDDVVWTRDRDFFQILNAPSSFADAGLSSLYGAAGAAERRGFLGMGAFLATQSKVNSTSPTQRGLFVRERFFCDTVPPPPPGVDFAAVDPVPNRPLTGRERYAMHAKGTCVTCHKMMDPIGFGLEKFDGVGAYRTTEVGKTIDDSGLIEMSSGGAAAPFKGLAQLADLLYMSPQVKRCANVQFVRWWQGRGEDPAEQWLLDDLAGKFAASGHSFKSFLLAAAASDGTRLMKAP